jgi:hypothetical protein
MREDFRWPFTDLRITSIWTGPAGIAARNPRKYADMSNIMKYISKKQPHYYSLLNDEKTCYFRV